MCLAREDRQLNKCHITLPLVGFFVIIIVERKKNFSPMKLLAKVVFGLLAYNYVKNDLRTPTIKKIGRVQNCEPYQIPNNGGL